MESNILKISTQSNPASVAGAITELLKTHNEVVLKAIGAGAVNQSVKAIAVARGYVAPSGMNLVCIPAFDETNIDGETKSLIKFIVKSII